MSGFRTERRLRIMVGLHESTSHGTDSGTVRYNVTTTECWQTASLYYEPEAMHRVETGVVACGMANEA